VSLSLTVNVSESKRTEDKPQTSSVATSHSTQRMTDQELQAAAANAAKSTAVINTSLLRQPAKALTDEDKKEVGKFPPSGCHKYSGIFGMFLSMHVQLSKYNSPLAKEYF